MGRTKNPKKSSSTGIIPNKDENIEKKVERLIEAGAYHPTGHAKERLDQREITIAEVTAVISCGKREKNKDEYHKTDFYGNRINRWAYAYRRKTLDERDLRVCVSIDGSRNKLLLIVTAIDIL